ncbi:MAG: alpha-L-fucosidase [Firmicutes bacterium]|nr:alpha-L-fucosidase [Bacillota bacterium]
MYIEKLIVPGILIALALFLVFFSLRGKIPGDPHFESGWATDNNGFAKDGPEVERLTAVVPTPIQLHHSKLEYYSFIHYGMNTFTGREWGTGKEDPRQYNPTRVDTDQWVRVLQESGSRGIVFTVKHHDGFCLYPSKYTEHSIANSPYQNGKGDIMGQLADSCRKYGMNLGIYLSPWDMHEKTYGTEAYNDYMVNQLTELCTNYGPLFMIWFDGARGKNVPEFKYDFERYYEVIRRLQPEAIIANCGPDVRWIGNEAGVVRPGEWSVVAADTADVDRIMEQSQQDEQTGRELKAFDHTAKDLGSRDALRRHPDLRWYPAEADVSLHPGWFYNKRRALFRKGVKKLCSLYYNSVGANASLLLNVPPNREGVIADRDVKVLKAFGDRIRKDFSRPISYQLHLGNAETMVAREEARDALSVEDDRGYSFADHEYIADLKLGQAAKVKRLVLKEDLTGSQRVEAFDVFARVNHAGIEGEEKYRKIAGNTVIGSKRIITFGRAVNTDTIRIVIRQSRGNPVLSFIGLYE